MNKTLQPAWQVLGIAALCLGACGTAPADDAAQAPARFIRELSAGHKQRIVLYGTSVTAHDYWGLDLRRALEKKYPGLSQVVNTAHSGWNSANGLADLQKRVLDEHPDALFLEFGVNDAVTRFHITPEMARKNLETMIDRVLAANPRCEIILQTMDVAWKGHGRSRPDLDKYYQVYRDVARERGLMLIDHYANWKRIVDHSRAAYAAMVPDGVHPTRAATREVVSPVIWASITGEKTDAVDRLIERIPTYTYTADAPSAARHPDTDPPGVLIDGSWDNPGSGSVQFDGDVNVTVDLAAARRVKDASMVVYYRQAPIAVQSMTFSTSVDGKTWKDAATVDAADAAKAGTEALKFTAPIHAEARYVRIHCSKHPDAAAMLLLEVIVR